MTLPESSFVGPRTTFLANKLNNPEAQNILQILHVREGPRDTDFVIRIAHSFHYLFLILQAE